MSVAQLFAEDDALPRMRLECEGERTLRLEPARDAGEDRRQIRHIDEHVGGDHEIEAVDIIARQEFLEVADGQFRIQALAARLLDHGRGQIDADKCIANVVQRFAHQPGAAAEIERTAKAQWPALRLGGLHQGAAQKRRRAVVQPLCQLPVETRRVLIEETLHICRRHRPRRVKPAKTGETERRAVTILGITSKRLAKRRQRPFAVIQQLTRFAERKPGRRETRRQFQRLRQQVRGGGNIAAGGQLACEGVAAVGDEIAGGEEDGRCHKFLCEPMLSTYLKAMRAEDLLKPMPDGLCCPDGDFYIDPVRPVTRALITHAHSDHARAGHGAVLATRETLDLMRVRYGPDFAGSTQEIHYGETVRFGTVTATFHPAGHVLGSAQICVESGSCRIVASGDYKDVEDPTCAPFEPIACDVFISEATFSLPVFRHPDAETEVAKLLHSVALFPERVHLVGAYSLGKAQRVIALIRQAGYEPPIYLHGALAPITRYYASRGISLGDIRLAREAQKPELAGAIVLAPPHVLKDLWARRFPDPVTAFASGWMRVRARARQHGVELPLVISDHADWDGLRAAIRATGAPTVWVTHGEEDALVHWCGTQGIRARPLHIAGYGDEDDEAAAEEVAA